MQNHKGEQALAAAVLVTLIEDVEQYEKTCEKRWLPKDKNRKESIFRNAADAIYCAFGNANDSLALWLSLADIPLATFRANIKSRFPLTCSKFGVI